jgi:hypothetical protein
LIFGFRHYVDEIRYLPRYYAAYSGNFVPIDSSETLEFFGFLGHRNIGTVLPLYAANITEDRRFQVHSYRLPTDLTSSGTEELSTECFRNLSCMIPKIFFQPTGKRNVDRVSRDMMAERDVNS